MNILRFIDRKIHTILFSLTGGSIRLEGKGIVKGIKCVNKGANNVAIIDAGASLTNCKFHFKGNNNTLHVSSGTHLNNVTFWFEDDNNRIDIGRMVTSEGSQELAACEGKNITIGDDCMFSYGIHVRTTDSHPILDSNAKRINSASDIYIGKHVWIGADVMLLKGTVIPDGCVIGARSMVTASLDANINSMIVGMPAKVIKENISWKRERV